MNIEWVNVADTAVKIGLGGVVSGIFTYMGLRYSHKSQQSKYVFEHKIKLVEQITADIDEYFATLIGVVNQIAGIAKNRKIKECENTPLTDVQWKLIHDVDALLVSSWPKRAFAVAKLRLLKANDVVEKLKKCTSVEYELRNKIIFDKEMYQYPDIQDYRKNLNVLISEVHSAMSDFYDSLLK